MTSPTQRTLAALRASGYTAAVVEHWNAFARRRVDLFGGLDIVAVRRGEPGVLGVQCTTASNLAARMKKLRELPAIAVFLAAKNRVEVHGWWKSGGRWKVKIATLTCGDVKPQIVMPVRRKRSAKQRSLFDD